MIKNYLFSLFASLIFIGSQAQSLKLQDNFDPSTLSKSKVSKLLKTQDKKKGTSHFKSEPSATIFVQEDFEAGNLPGDFGRFQSANSMGWIVDTLENNPRWDVADRADPTNKYFAVSNDNKFDNPNGALNKADNDILTTPYLDFSGITDAAMVFDYYFSGEFGSAAAVEASADKGATWTSIITLGQDTNWQAGNLIYLTDFVGNDSVLVRFVHQDFGGHASGFAIDNLLIKEAEFDAAAGVGIGGQFVFTPLKQAQAIPFVGAVLNTDVGKISGISMQLDLATPSAPAFAPYAIQSIPDTLIGYDGIIFPFTPNFTPSELGLYVLRGTVDIAQNDHTVENDTGYYAFAISDSVLARDNDNILTEFPLGPDFTAVFDVPASIEISQTYFTPVADTLTSVSFAVGATAEAGDKYTATILKVVNGLPDYSQSLGFSREITVDLPAGDARFYTAELTNGLIAFAAGDTFAISISCQPLNGQFSTLAVTNGRYEPFGATVRIALPAFGFEQIQDFNPEAVPVIRANFGEVPSVLPSDISVSKISFTDMEYPVKPKSQVRPMTFNAEVSNEANGPASNVTLDVTIFKANTGAVIYSASKSITSLAPGTSAPIGIGTFTPDTGQYLVRYLVSMTETDSRPLNDTAYATFSISDSVFTRANFSNLNTINFGSRTNFGGGPDAVEFGTRFNVLNADTLSSVSLYLANFKAGDRFFAKVYPAGDSAIDLQNPIASSLLFTTPAGIPGQASRLVVPFQPGVVLQAGTYFVEMNMLPTDTANRTAVVSGGGVYSKNASGVVYLNLFFDLANFGPNFSNATLLIDANFGAPLKPTSIGENKLADDIILYPNPAKQLINLSNVANSQITIYNLLGEALMTSYSYNSTTAINTSQLAAGTYVVSITSALGTAHKTLIINN